MSTIQARALRLCTVLAALVAVSQSYHALALRASEWAPWPLAWTYPLSVDGLLVAGMLAGYVLRRDKFRRRAYGWFVLALGLGVSLLGNAPPGLIPDATIALRVFPPVSLALTLHLLILLNRPERQSRAPKPVPAEQPEQRPEQTPSIDVLALPSVNGGSGSAKARALLAAAWENGGDIKAPDLAKRAEISESRARDIRAKALRERAQVSVPG